MCGIFGVVKKQRNNISNIQKCFDALKRRGPDSQTIIEICVKYQQNTESVDSRDVSDLQQQTTTIIGFSRLSIMQMDDSGMQPYIFESNNQKILFVCNGEIYNFKQLAKDHNLEEEYQINVENRDCIIIPLLYMKYEFQQFCDLFKKEIKGEFAFSIFQFDNNDVLQSIVLARDMIGIRPLYMSKEQTDQHILAFASNIKALEFHDGDICHFKPGSIQKITFERATQSKQEQLQIKSTKIVDFDYIYNIVPSYNIDEIQKDNKIPQQLKKIRESLINAVKIRLQSDQPIAFLLAGVDSSLVCSIASKLTKDPIYTFTVGNSNQTSDMISARKVSQFIGSIHTEIIIPYETALQNIPEVIQGIGSWDQTTIRASTYQYLLCKYIRENTIFRVILNGDVSDEVFSGYLYNYELQKDEYIDISSKLMVQNLHKYDVLRVDSCISQNSLEARIPFSDQDLIQACWEIPFEIRHPRYQNMEKWVLRQAFAVSNNQPIQYLPEDLLYRTKHAMSNAVSDCTGKTWIQYIKDYCISQGTTELQYYKDIFIQHFGSNRLNVLDKYWNHHKFNESGVILDDFVDSSAEILTIYNQKLTNNAQGVTLVIPTRSKLLSLPLKEE